MFKIISFKTGKLSTGQCQKNENIRELKGSLLINIIVPQK